MRVAERGSRGQQIFVVGGGDSANRRRSDRHRHQTGFAVVRVAGDGRLAGRRFDKRGRVPGLSSVEQAGARRALGPLGR